MNSNYPLVNVYIAMNKSTMLVVAKLTAFLWPFSIANCKSLPDGNWRDIASQELGIAIFMSMERLFNNALIYFASC